MEGFDLGSLDVGNAIINHYDNDAPQRMAHDL